MGVSIAVLTWSLINSIVMRNLHYHAITGSGLPLLLARLVYRVAPLVLVTVKVKPNKCEVREVVSNLIKIIHIVHLIIISMGQELDFDQMLLQDCLM